MNVGVRRNAWAWWGAAAGIAGLVANVVTDDQADRPAEGAGPEVIVELSRASYHVGVLAGFVAVACLIGFAAGWRRWARTGKGDLGFDAVPTALTVSAAAMLVGYGVKGALAEYLPGGVNDDNFSDEALLTLFVMNDTAPWHAWWGVLFAAAFIAVTSLRSRALPLWLGVLAAVAVLLPLGIAIVSGAVAIAGLIGPVWLVVASVAIALRRDGPAGPDAQETPSPTGHATPVPPIPQ